MLVLASVSVLSSHMLLALGLNPDCAWLTWLDADLHLSSIFYQSRTVFSSVVSPHCYVLTSLLLFKGISVLELWLSPELLCA